MYGIKFRGSSRTTILSQIRQLLTRSNRIRNTDGTAHGKLSVFTIRALCLVNFLCHDVKVILWCLTNISWCMIGRFTIKQMPTMSLCVRNAMQGSIVVTNYMVPNFTLYYMILWESESIFMWFYKQWKSTNNKILALSEELIISTSIYLRRTIFCPGMSSIWK